MSVMRDGIMRGGIMRGGVMRGGIMRSQWGGYAGTSLIAFGALKGNTTLTRTTTATYWGL